VKLYTDTGDAAAGRSRWSRVVGAVVAQSFTLFAQVRSDKTRCSSTAVAPFHA
jgi:hypothetical protein